MNAQTIFTTERAGQYLASLCKHFGHKVPVQYDPRSGRIELPFGQCDLAADEATLTLTARAENQPDLDRTIGVMTSHLERFAFRENPHLAWAPPQTPARPDVAVGPNA
tara:strand:+ start:1149 stop:1472 length:324 start_codon:yes stop_codon:yes gene_type:complete